MKTTLHNIPEIQLESFGASDHRIKGLPLDSN